MFVCLLGSGKYRLIFNIKLNKIKYITQVGDRGAPKKEPNAGIGEIISPIESATQKKIVTTEGFEPSPFRNSALNYRLRPLGQIVIVIFILFLPNLNQFH